uniref:Calcium-gated potassium channel MthK n=1 Tax=Candidatus Methanogaster sp. ANME-2c ERB4 TaxID=2759911 RepID=A0A7G9Y6Y0_9EURY|nr:calcium-gated potassium channel MthK [Methanosarcinales archaeon ANME-2c ERB4]QNO43886.1 calcium-gated potassium channel MthK [Methanosarcinales archaeon ANME-2c ERB4]
MVIEKEKRLVVVGYGDVGKSIVDELKRARTEFVVVDRNEDVLLDKGFDYVVGDGSNEEILRRAGVASASTIIIALNIDTDAIFATLVARTLNPDAIILTRANAPICDKIYRAGADYVASVSIVVGQMVAKLVISEHEEDVVMLYEGLEIEKYHVREGSPFTGKTLEELDLRSNVGCTVIGIEKEGRTVTDIHGKTTIEEDSILAIVGGKEQIRKFEEYENMLSKSPEMVMIEKIGEIFR